MKEVVYKSSISDIRWMVYDVPGNVGWILYLICLALCFGKWPAFMDVPLVQMTLTVGVLPAIAMIVGIVELISERILKLDRVLPKKRLYRGLGALTWSGSPRSRGGASGRLWNRRVCSKKRTMY